MKQTEMPTLVLFGGNGRQARVWLARRAVHLKRVEVGLTSRVAAIADRLASSDDSRSVSAVFGEVSHERTSPVQH